MMKRRHKIIAAVAAGLLAATGTAWAISATLTVNSSEAGTNAGISGCDTAWTAVLGTPVYDATLGQYAYTTVAFSGVSNACLGKTIAFTVADDTLAAVSGGTATVAGTTGTVTLTSPVSSARSYTLATAIYS